MKFLLFPILLVVAGVFAGVLGVVYGGGPILVGVGLGLAICGITVWWQHLQTRSIKQALAAQVLTMLARMVLAVVAAVLADRFGLFASSFVSGVASMGGVLALAVILDAFVLAAQAGQQSSAPRESIGA